MQVLEVGMANLQGTYQLSGTAQMAAATAAVIPMILLCVLGQKYFIRGMRRV
jgi:ABC-type glycerol-3-phosphate transport system permease component